MLFLNEENVDILLDITDLENLEVKTILTSLKKDSLSILVLRIAFPACILEQCFLIFHAWRTSKIIFYDLHGPQTLFMDPRSRPFVLEPPLYKQPSCVQRSKKGDFHPKI